MVYDVRIKNKNEIVKYAVEAEIIICLDFIFSVCNIFIAGRKRGFSWKERKLNEDEKRKDTV